ncbi:MAG: maleylacetoacetate isomerase [Gammaproteobacteria bacterium]|nr:maleylacetoacetate isomerase [Gammaproteobacteria bacterium]MCH9763269.1 maleylacetoacetate isomerase [Gammaproteobacteria bacterium]
MKLYDYYRSTASYRVRITLNLKQLAFECIPVHLVNHGGEQHLPAYRELNPQGLVPTLIDNNTITQSLAIMEYLEESYPAPALLPQMHDERATVRSLSFLIACDMHPLNNLRVLKQLKSQFNATEEDVTAWYHHWLKTGFDAFEAKLKQLPRDNPHFCDGHQVSFADICLIPQVFNAERFKFSLKPYPLIESINAHCLTLDAFKKAAPQNN